jgi:hypothetical protein
VYLLIIYMLLTPNVLLETFDDFGQCNEAAIAVMITVNEDTLKSYKIVQAECKLVEQEVK